MKKIRSNSMVHILKFLLLVILTFMPVLLLAQVQNDEENQGTIRTQRFDTRSLSLGSATLADIYGRVSIGINPALIGLEKNRNSFRLNAYQNWNNNIGQYDLTFPTLSLDSHYLSARVGITRPGFDVVNYFGDATLPEPDLNGFQLDVAYAYALGDYFSVGTLQSLYYSYNDDAQFMTYFADIGLAYAPEGLISYGITFRGLGRESTYEIIETGITTLGSSIMGKRLEVGLTFIYPDEDKPYLSMSFSNQKRFGQDGVWYKGGIEVLPLSVFSLRSGLLFNLEQSVLVPRYGAGINIGMLRMDYMVALKKIREEYFHQIGITIEF